MSEGLFAGDRDSRQNLNTPRIQYPITPNHPTLPMRPGRKIRALKRALNTRMVQAMLKRRGL